MLSTKIKQKIKRTKKFSKMLKDIATSITISYNKDLFGENEEDKSNRIIVAFSLSGKRVSLWSFDSSNKISNYKYHKEIDSNLITSIMDTHKFFPKKPIYIEQNKIFERSKNEKWKYLTFSKYAGLHIDDIIDNDTEFAKELLYKYLGKPSVVGSKYKAEKNTLTLYDKLSKFRQKKLEKYIINKKDEILITWDKIIIEKANEIADKSNKVFIGTIGELVQITASVKEVIKEKGRNVYILKDNNQNTIVKYGFIDSRFITIKYNQKSQYLRKSDTVSFKAIIANHKIDTRFNIGDKVTYLKGDITELNKDIKKKSKKKTEKKNKLNMGFDKFLATEWSDNGTSRHYFNFGSDSDS